MSEQEIQDILTGEYNAFLREPFPSQLPGWFIAKLPGAIMSLPQSTVPYHSERIQQMLLKTVEELSIFETGLMVNIFLAVKPEVFGWTIEEFLMNRTQVEKVRAIYADITKKEEDRLTRKKSALQNMGGQKENHKSNGLAKV